MMYQLYYCHVSDMHTRLSPRQASFAIDVDVLDYLDDRKARRRRYLHEELMVRTDLMLANLKQVCQVTGFRVFDDYLKFTM